MDEKWRAEQREYMRLWRRKNADRVRAYNAMYWERRAKKRLQQRDEERIGLEVVQRDGKAGSER